MPGELETGTKSPKMASTHFLILGCLLEKSNLKKLDFEIGCKNDGLANKFNIFW